MEDELYSSALGNTLKEIPKICPDVKNAFIIRENGQIIAKDEKTPEKTVDSAKNALENLFEKAEAVGGVENTIIECSRGRVNVSSTNGFYLVTVTSTKADMSYVNSVTGILVPTVLRLLEKIAATSITVSSPDLEDKIPPKETAKKAAKSVKQTETEKDTETARPEREAKRETATPQLSVTQFIVENIKGLLVKSDTTRIDNDMLLQWKELCEDRDIEEVEIETFTGKKIRCKVKPIKDSKYKGKGKIQMPEKIQDALDIRKGELVKVKPVIE